MYKIIGADGKEYGPVSADQLRHWISQGRVYAGTQAVAEGMTDWKPLGSFPEFAYLFAAAAAAPAVFVSVPTRKTNGFAIAGLILGIISLFTFCLCGGLPFNVLGLTFSIVALVQVRGNPQQYEGHGLAIAGLVLSIVGIVLAVLLLLFRMMHLGDLGNV